MTGNTLIAGALRLIGVLGEGETPSATEGADAFSALNDMIDAWALEPLMIYYVLRTVKTLASNKASYSIGTGATDINIARPDRLENAGLIIDQTANPVTEIPLDIFTDQQWEGIRQKGIPSPYARGVYYDRGWTSGGAPGQGTIQLYPVPSIGTTQLVLYSLQALTAFPDFTTNITFPPGYAKLLRYGLAIDLSPEFGRVPSQSVVAEFTRVRTRIKNSNANARPIAAVIDPRVPGRNADNLYNWKTDQAGPSR